MIIINEDKWDEIKELLLGSADYRLNKEPLVRYDHGKNQQETIGARETYEFSKNDVDYMVILDKEHKLTKTTSEKDGRYKEQYSRSPTEIVYKLSVKFCDKDGNWKDSSALGNL